MWSLRTTFLASSTPLIELSSTPGPNASSFHEHIEKHRNELLVLEILRRLIRNYTGTLFRVRFVTVLFCHLPRVRGHYYTSSAKSRTNRTKASPKSPVIGPKGPFHAMSTRKTRHHPFSRRLPRFWCKTASKSCWKREWMLNGIEARLFVRGVPEAKP